MTTISWEGQPSRSRPWPQGRESAFHNHSDRGRNLIVYCPPLYSAKGNVASLDRVDEQRDECPETENPQTRSRTDVRSARSSCLQQGKNRAIAHRLFSITDDGEVLLISRAAS